MKKTAAALMLAALLAAGCSSAASHHTQRSATTADLAGSAGTVHDMQTGQELRLGYLEDLGSAPALDALQAGYYRQNMDGVSVQAQGFASDLDEVFALEHGQLDAAYLDPVAAVSAWQFMATGSLRIVAGAATGPSELIARPGITSPAQLRGTRVEAPADSSQAAALSTWLRALHLTGHVQLDGSAVTTAGILQQFSKGTISAAWEPAPLDQQLIAAGGHPLAATPPTATSGVLVVTTRYMTADPAAVRDLLTVQRLACQAFITHPAATRAAATQALAATTGIRTRDSELAALFAHQNCTLTPGIASITAQAKTAAATGITRPVTSWTDLYDLRPR